MKVKNYLNKSVKVRRYYLLFHVFLTIINLWLFINLLCWLDDMKFLNARMSNLEDYFMMPIITSESEYIDAVIQQKMKKIKGKKQY